MTDRSKELLEKIACVFEETGGTLDKVQAGLDQYRARLREVVSEHPVESLNTFIALSVLVDSDVIKDKGVDKAGEEALVWLMSQGSAKVLALLTFARDGMGQMLLDSCQILRDDN